MIDPTIGPAIEPTSNPALAAIAALGLAVALDLTVEEFPERIHPVAIFGRLVAPLDRDWAVPRLVGGPFAIVLPLVAGTIAGALTLVAIEYSLVLGVAVAGLVLFSTTSLRMLLSTADDVIDATADPDLASAKETAIALVGRSRADLSADELRSAAVESAAENLADGLVAPLLAFALGATIGLPIAAGAAAWVKAVNTLDSMFGYPSKPHGTAAARLDDAVMWLPARIAAVCIAIAALAAGSPGSLRRARSWHDDPASPNSGWPMATLAAAVDTRLEKRGAYALNPDADLPDVETARRGVRIVALAGITSVGVAVFFLLAVGLLSSTVVALLAGVALLSDGTHSARIADSVEVTARC